MKSEIERRRHRRAVNTLGLVLSTLGPLTLSLLFAPMSAARASTLLIGDVTSGSYSYPCVTCTLTGEFSYFFNPFVVLAGPAETTLFLGNPTTYSAWNVNFEANSVTLTMAPAPLLSVSYSPDPFNGPVFTVLSGNSFGSVTGLVENNPTCLPCTPITAFVSGDSLFINWQGAGGSVGATVTVYLSGGEPIAPVPIPGAGLPFGLSLASGGLLGWWRRRQKIAEHPAHCARRSRQPIAETIAIYEYTP